MATPKGVEATALQDAAKLRCTLAADLHAHPAQSQARPYLVVLSGLPGTGKSHFARELVKRLPFIIVGSDRSRKALVSRPKYTKGEHARVFAACHLLIEQLLGEGHGIIFDATNLTEHFRQPLYEMAERTRAILLVVWFTASREVVRRRLDDRANGRSEDNYSDADWLVYCRLRPGEEIITRPHLVVDSSEDICPALEEVVRRISGHE
ncbi:MAG TPA: ATP-binding protein [Dehalococcoidia bacterium]|jgi:predicted kinase|nr:ATP-binding protein [Dehalococcoidia bacterium]